MTLLLVLVTFLVSGSVNAAMFGSSTYDDCILEHMKGIGDRGAAFAVEAACRRKFPEAKPEPKRTSQPPASGGAPNNSGRFTDFAPDKPK